MAKQIKSKTNYGNWVSKRIIYAFSSLTAVFSVFTLFFVWLLIPALLFLGIAIYFAYARYLFSPKGANVQNQIWETAISNLDWKGQGKALDIGCGNGALSVKVAHKFSDAQVVGIDFWGERWDYSKSSCEANAYAEGVAGRVSFQKASALKLPFEDQYFDAAISNLCFHEVSDAKDKREVIREALRVVKKGGVFAFQDLFLLKQVYGDTNELLQTMKSWGTSKVEFIETKNLPFVPAVLKLPFMVGRMGIIKGEK